MKKIVLIIAVLVLFQVVFVSSASASGPRDWGGGYGCGYYQSGCYHPYKWQSWYHPYPRYYPNYYHRTWYNHYYPRYTYYPRYHYNNCCQSYYYRYYRSHYWY
jgi:hypothetical protein